MDVVTVLSYVQLKDTNKNAHKITIENNTHGGGAEGGEEGGEGLHAYM